MTLADVNQPVARWTPRQIEASTPVLRSVDRDRTYRVGDTCEMPCATHGTFTATLMDRVFPPHAAHWWTQCPACDEQMTKEAAAAHERAMGSSPEGRDQLLDQAVRLAGVPKRFSKCQFHHFKTPLPGQHRARLAVHDYARSFGGVSRLSGANLVLIGNVGTGKTHLACAMLREVAKQGGTIRYLTETDAVALVQATYGGQGNRDAILANMIAPDMLVLDEVGRAGGSADAGKIIGEIIDKRYREVRPTCVVTNATAAGLRNWIGEAALSRLDTHGTRTIKCRWPDVRASGIEDNPEDDA